MNDDIDAEVAGLDDEWATIAENPSVSDLVARLDHSMAELERWIGRRERGWW